VNNHLSGIILVLAGLVSLVYAGISLIKNTTRPNNVKRLLFSGIIGAVIFIVGMSIVINTTEEKVLLTPYGFLKTTASH